VTSLPQSVGPVHTARQYSGSQLSHLPPTSTHEVRKLLTMTCLKPSPIDVLPTVLLRSFVVICSPIITHIANLSFAECHFPSAFKTAQVLPLLKKPGLDKEQMSNYRLI